MKNNASRLPDSAVGQVVGGSVFDQLVSPSPSTGPLPCVNRNRADLTNCPYAEAERLCYNCEGCSLNKPEEAPAAGIGIR